MCTIEPELINLYSGVFDLKTEIEKYDLRNTDEALNICDLTSVINKFNTWMKHMPNVMPFYAVKCNDHPFILQTLANLGTGFDCASKNELKQVIDFGVSPDRIIFANPMKPTSHIQFAKSKNITDSTVDNEFEIYKIFKYYPRSNMILRFRSEAKKAQCPLGYKFGCEAYDDGAALMILAKSLNMNMAGVSFHVGSGCSDLPAYDKAIHTAGNLFQFGKFIGHNIEILDIGGGFPGDDDVMFADIAKIVNNSLRVHFDQIKVKIIAEPGRFFVASAYTLVCKVYSKREIRTNDGRLEKIMYYLNDGLYGTFNCILYDHNEIKAVHFMHGEAETFNSLIWGPTCDALDKICDNVLLPNLKEGDLLAFPNMGAYTVPIASPFNGFNLPKTRFYLRNNYG